MDSEEKKAPMPGAMGMPPMMQQMMQKMMAGMQEFNPMAMCQAMMTSVGKAAEMAAYATPEVRTLFEEWARSVEDEMLALLQTHAAIGVGNKVKGSIALRVEGVHPAGPRPVFIY